MVNTRWRLGLLMALLLALTGPLGGCAYDPNNPDPLEGVNRFFYGVNDELDAVVFKPLSDVYVAILPPPVRAGLANAFDNLTYADTIVNALLQGKLDQGRNDALRMLANSTLGLAGVFDVASDLGLPEHNEDFGQTLATWGVEQGPYLVLPVLGPSTLRDTPGIGVSIVTNPIYWIDPPLYVTIPLATLGAADARTRAGRAFGFRDDAALDPYVFTRDAYLQHRRMLIHDGHPPVAPPVDYFDEGDDSPAATQPAP